MNGIPPNKQCREIFDIPVWQNCVRSLSSLTQHLNYCPHYFGALDHYLSSDFHYYAHFFTARGYYLLSRFPYCVHYFGGLNHKVSLTGSVKRCVNSCHLVSTSIAGTCCFRAFGLGFSKPCLAAEGPCPKWFQSPPRFCHLNWRRQGCALSPSKSS